MRMQTKLPIVTVVGAAALLLTVLAVVIAPPSQTAYAQNDPSPTPVPFISVDLLDYTVPTGEYLYAGFSLRYFPCTDQDNDNDCDNRDKFTSVTYRFDVLSRGSGGTNVDSCEGQGLNRVSTFSSAFYDWRRTLGPLPLRIDKNCPRPGRRIHTSSYWVKYTDPGTTQSHPLTDTVDFSCR